MRHSFSEPDSFVRSSSIRFAAVPGSKRFATDLSKIRNGASQSFPPAGALGRFPHIELAPARRSEFLSPDGQPMVDQLSDAKIAVEKPDEVQKRDLLRIFHQRETIRCIRSDDISSFHQSRKHHLAGPAVFANKARYIRSGWALVLTDVAFRRFERQQDFNGYYDFGGKHSFRV